MDLLQISRLCFYQTECSTIWAVPGAMRTAIVLFLLLVGLTATPQVLPKPQVPSAAGKPAPTFTLQDQQGKMFRLGSLRGHRVLLIFYRGYW